VTGRRTAENRKSKLSLGQVLNLVVTVLVLCLGPAMIVFGQHLINIDEELARTGTHTTGTIVEFDDVTKASERDIEVEFMSLDGTYHVTWAAVDHDQHPEVGSYVTVVYREADPSHAIVLGYESDGVWFRGAGTLITALFVMIGVIVAISVAVGRSKRRKNAAVDGMPVV
jgi:hypothetical protein